MANRRVIGLIAKLQTGVLSEQYEAAKALGAVKDPEAVLALIAVLEDEQKHFYLRGHVAEALGKIGNPSAVPALFEALTNQYGLASQEAATALALIGDSRAVPVLIKTLKDKALGQREAAAALMTPAFRTPRNPEVVTALIKAFSDPDCDWYIRYDIAEAFGETREVQAVPALVSALTHTDIRLIAAEALVKIGPPAVPALIAAFNAAEEQFTTHWHIAETLVEIGPPAVPGLIASLQNPGRGVRHMAAEALGKIADPQAVPALMEALKDQDKNTYVSEAAAKALIQLLPHYSNPDLRAALPFLRRLQKRDPIFREAFEKIEIATAPFKDLPRLADAPLRDAGTLPRPAAAEDVPIAAEDVPIATSTTPPHWWVRLRRALTRS